MPQISIAGLLWLALSIPVLATTEFDPGLNPILESTLDCELVVGSTWA